MGSAQRLDAEASSDGIRPSNPNARRAERRPLERLMLEGIKKYLRGSLMRSVMAARRRGENDVFANAFGPYYRSTFGLEVDWAGDVAIRTRVEEFMRSLGDNFDVGSNPLLIQEYHRQRAGIAQRVEALPPGDSAFFTQDADLSLFEFGFPAPSIVRDVPDDFEFSPGRHRMNVLPTPGLRTPEHLFMAPFPSQSKQAGWVVHRGGSSASTDFHC